MSDETTKDTPEGQENAKYGISIFELEDDSVIVHVTGEPDLGQLQRLLAGALANLNADITARKVLMAFQQAKQSQRIIRP